MQLFLLSFLFILLSQQLEVLVLFRKNEESLHSFGFQYKTPISSSSFRFIELYNQSKTFTGGQSGLMALCCQSCGDGFGPICCLYSLETLNNSFALFTSSLSFFSKVTGGQDTSNICFIRHNNLPQSFSVRSSEQNPCKNLLTDERKPLTVESSTARKLFAGFNSFLEPNTCAAPSKYVIPVNDCRVVIENPDDFPSKSLDKNQTNSCYPIRFNRTPEDNYFNEQIFSVEEIIAPTLPKNYGQTMKLLKAKLI